MAFESVAVDELKAQMAAAPRRAGRDADFFLRFADRGGLRCFALFDPAAGSIDLSCPETALLFDEERFATANDEEQHGDVARLPAFPIDVGERLHASPSSIPHHERDRLSRRCSSPWRSPSLRSPS